MGNKLRVPMRLMMYRMGCVNIKDWMGLHIRDMMIDKLMPVKSMAAMVVTNWLNCNMVLWENMMDVLDMVNWLVMNWMMWADTICG